jgi:hypothetical protein
LLVPIAVLHAELLATPGIISGEAHEVLHRLVIRIGRTALYAAIKSGALVSVRAFFSTLQGDQLKPMLVTINEACQASERD